MDYGSVKLVCGCVVDEYGVLESCESVIVVCEF
jgi:hypothetical protein